MKEEKLFIAVKACIVNEDDKVLLLRESAAYEDGTNIAKYDVPGGRIEGGEKLENALAREVFEETGLRVVSFEFLDAHDTFNEKHGEVWHIVRLFYKVHAEGEVILSLDHDEYQWVPLKDIQVFGGIIDNLIPTIQKIRF